MIPYAIQPRVTAAITDIYRYSTRRWGQERADAYISGFFDLFALIAERAFPWRSVPAELGITGYRHRYERHVIYWRLASNGTVIIVAVLHERMLQLERLQDFMSNDIDFAEDQG